MYFIGIDLGGTNIAAGITDEKGKIILKDSTPTLSERDNVEIINDISALCEKIITTSGIDRKEIKAVGIGSPGTCNPIDGIIVRAYNIGFENVEIKKMLEERLNLPVYLENDANCAAFGEFMVGTGKEYKSAIAITLGTGLGGGYIQDGKIISGSYYGGGEFGHIVISVGGNQCTCGRKGCWEAYSSATALIKATIEAAKLNKDSLINTLVNNDYSKVTAKVTFDAMHQGDKVAKEVVDDYLLYLAEGITNLINALEPEIIVLGGGVSAQGDVLLTPLVKLVNERSFGGVSKTKLGIASLGNDAGIIGAALLGK